MQAKLECTAAHTHLLDIVNGFRFIPGSHYLQHTAPEQWSAFQSFYAAQVAEDPYAPGVRDRGMLKIVFNPFTQSLSLSDTQNYFQSYGANDSDGGRVRVFPGICPSLIDDPVFISILEQDAELMRVYCERLDRQTLNLSVHFIRYKAEEGGASYSSPVWLHLDDEPLVFIHLIQLTNNALGADNVISGMDNKPTNVLRLVNPLDTLVVDTMKKHAVTPLGSSGGMAYRDVMLINLEADLQQK